MIFKFLSSISHSHACVRYLW